MNSRSYIIFFIFFISTLYSQNLPEKFTLTAAGKFVKNIEYERESENGTYSCNFDIVSAGDEIRELKNFIFYKNGSVQYKLESVPGSDLYISNSGISAFFDHTFHFNNKIQINFYSPSGVKLSSADFGGAYLFGFSQDGNIMGIGTPGMLTLLNSVSGERDIYPGCMSFDLSEYGKNLVLADENNIYIYCGKELLNRQRIDSFVRKIKIIDNSSFCYITKNEFKVISLQNFKELFSASFPSDYILNDILFSDGKIYLGMNNKVNRNHRGFFAQYENGKLSTPVMIISQDHNKPVSIPEVLGDSLYQPIPWPFFPFDSARVVWNHYEQHMGYGTPGFAYLHQGLDLIVPIEEPVYAVQQGIVKCVLTLGGDVYWRVAISPVQQSERSDGWLYAHLIQSTIPVFTGDTVMIHDFLGDIIEWTPEWGHIHFVQINDTGMVWLYNDNQWGINFNPLLALQPMIDNDPPHIVNCTPSSKFEFCRNETSTYLSSSNLSGQVDIIIKVIDTIGIPGWQQPAFKSSYSIKRIADDQVVLPEMTGHILNHSYDRFASTEFQPFAPVLYKNDNQHPVPSWMDTERDFFHIITNNNGDELIDTSERSLSLDTRLFYDGWYRIYVTVYDPSGNSDHDSMDVKFVNGFVSMNDPVVPHQTDLFQNYPNPFNPSTTISFTLSESLPVKLLLYNVMGEEVLTLNDDVKPAGFHSIDFNPAAYNLSSGIYFYKLSAGNFNSVKKMLYLK